jgi:ACS family tartrate transporter-like MFS transporter
MFLLEAVPAVVLAFGVWFWLPDGPRSATWLDSREKEAVAAALAAEQRPGTGGHEGLGQVLRTGKAWALGLAFFCQLGTSYAMIFSLPIVLKQLTGWNAGRVGFLVAFNGLLGVAMMVSGAWLSDRSGRRRPFVVGGFLVMAVAAAVTGVHLSGWLGVVALLSVSLAFFWLQGPMLNSMTTLLPGRSAAMVIAFTNTFGICGGFVGPYWMGWMREATGGYAWGLGLLCVPCFLAAGLMTWVLEDRG